MHHKRLFSIPETALYQKVHKISIEKQREKNIKNKLEIDKRAHHFTSKRKSQQGYFLQCSYNPFSQNIKPSKSAFSYYSPNRKPSHKKNKRTISQGISPHKDLVTEINSLMQPDTINKKIQKSMKYAVPLNTITSQSHNMTSKILNHIDNKKKNPKYQFSFEQNLKSPEDPSENKNVKKEKVQKQQLGHIPLDEIINMKEKSFFHQKQSNINIFNIIHNDQSILCGKQQLDKHNFFFGPTQNSTTDIKIDINRDISEISRRSIRNVSDSINQVIDNLNTDDLSLNKSAINFNDMMNLASGRFIPDFMVHFDEENKQGGMDTKSIASQSSEEQQLVIPYKNMTENRKDQFEAENEEVQQIKVYSRLQRDIEENELSKKYQRLIDCLEILMDEKKQLSELRIQDKELMSQKNQGICNIISNLIKTNPQHNKYEKDTAIRKKKNKKTRFQSIKLQNSIRALNKKEKNDNYFYSPLKTGFIS